MRYYIKCKLNPSEKQRLRETIETGSLARGNIFYEGMQTALREGTIDENNIVHFVEICYCLEGGLYPMTSINDWSNCSNCSCFFIKS
jgi:hypothetical protein